MCAVLAIWAVVFWLGYQYHYLPSGGFCSKRVSISALRADTGKMLKFL